MPTQARRGRPLTNVELADSLCLVSTALQEFRRLHETSFGTLIPHIFMSEVLAYVGASLRTVASTPGAVLPGEVGQILDTLELGMASGDRETKNVISMSFVGDGELEPFFTALRPMLGIKLRAQLQGK
jgi:hypothetical protein